MQNIVFIGINKDNGNEVRGWYFENEGIGYIISKDELIQTPIRRTYIVDPKTVRFEIDEKNSKTRYDEFCQMDKMVELIIDSQLFDAKYCTHSPLRNQSKECPFEENTRADNCSKCVRAWLEMVVEE